VILLNSVIRSVATPLYRKSFLVLTEHQGSLLLARGRLTACLRLTISVPDQDPKLLDAKCWRQATVEGYNNWEGLEFEIGKIGKLGAKSQFEGGLHMGLAREMTSPSSSQ
jgi:hypothetical protein